MHLSAKRRSRFSAKMVGKVKYITEMHMRLLDCDCKRNVKLNRLACYFYSNTEGTFSYNLKKFVRQMKSFKLTCVTKYITILLSYLQSVRNVDNKMSIRLVQSVPPGTTTIDCRRIIYRVSRIVLCSFAILETIRHRQTVK